MTEKLFAKMLTQAWPVRSSLYSASIGPSILYLHAGPAERSCTSFHICVIQVCGPLFVVLKPYCVRMKVTPM